jgi:20S proteasome alpha/beta subunit
MSSFLVSTGYLVRINQSADIFFQATSAGLKEQEAINFLEKKMKDDPQFTYDETVQVMLDKAVFFV